MASPRFQIISDLHLETPFQPSAYAYFSSPYNFPIEGDHLFLLGDIGLIAHTQALLAFLRSLLRRDTRLRIFYILGSHEAYNMTLGTSLTEICSWETTLNTEFGARFHVMNRTRIDLSPTKTLLGCTLWSYIPPAHQQEVALALKDIHATHGIRDRSMLSHNADHVADVSWLNIQVSLITANEPQREVVVLTHQSPMIDGRANSKRFPSERALNSAFRTDLSGEARWTSPRVKVWCYGHTHFSCQFVDSGEGRRKLVMSNQKGYSYELGKGSWEVKPVVVGREEGAWRVVVGAMEASE